MPTPTYAELLDRAEPRNPWDLNDALDELLREHLPREKAELAHALISAAGNRHTKS